MKVKICGIVTENSYAVGHLKILMILFIQITYAVGHIKTLMVLVFIGLFLMGLL